MGFYIRDNYDFNGLQYLGTWTKNRILTKPEAALSTTFPGRLILKIENGAFAAVMNSDFRSYREKFGKGGDFVIYSDIFWKRSGQIIDLGVGRE